MVSVILSLIRDSRPTEAPTDLYPASGAPRSFNQNLALVLAATILYLSVQCLSYLGDQAVTTRS